MSLFMQTFPGPVLGMLKKVSVNRDCALVKHMGKEFVQSVASALIEI